MAAEQIDLYSLLRLLAVPGVGPNKLRALISYFRTAAAVFDASEKRLTQVPGVDSKIAFNIRSFDGHDFAANQVKAIESAKVNVLTFWDADFPALLKQIYDPPAVLFVNGDVGELNKPAVAVVGSRTPTSYGKVVAEKFSAELVAKGFCVISGLAYGIDTIAHRAALAVRGRTVAVLGSGLDVIYPAENRRLTEQIPQSGAVVSEYPLGTGPDRGNFPRRNRIICGLSLGVIVVEAGEKSGALITANMALDQNREVFAVPGNINSKKSFGTNQLIKQGATVVTEIEDVVRALEPFVAETRQERTTVDIALDSEQESIMRLLSNQPMHIDRIASATQQRPQLVLSHLLTLELLNLVKQLPGKLFVKA